MFTNWFGTWLKNIFEERERQQLKNLVRKVVIQGNHKYRITEYNKILIDAARKEFTEDNKPTLNGFLEDCHKDALK